MTAQTPEPVALLVDANAQTQTPVYPVEPGTLGDVLHGASSAAMVTMSTSEIRGELMLHELSPQQIDAVLTDAQNYGGVMFASPSTGRQVVITADDDSQAWGYVTEPA